MPFTYAHYRMGEEVIKQVSAPAGIFLLHRWRLHDH